MKKPIIVFSFRELIRPEMLNNIIESLKFLKEEGWIPIVLDRQDESKVQVFRYESGIVDSFTVEELQDAISILKKSKIVDDCEI